MLGRQLPKVESMLRGAAADITAFADFPVPHWKKISRRQRVSPGAP
jgi:putative transposase